MAPIVGEGEPRRMGADPDPAQGIHRSSPLTLAERKPRCEDRGIDRRLVVAVLAAPATALVVLAVVEAGRHPDHAPGGGSAAALGVQAAAGLALAAAAVHVVRRWELALGGALLVAAAGLALHTLPEPPDGAVLFTLALVGAGVPAAAAAHAALLHPGGRLMGKLDRVAVATGYVVTIGLLPAVFLDPRTSGCFACPDNLLLVRSDPGASDWLTRWTSHAATATQVALAALVVARLLQRPPAARSLAAPVSAAAVAVLVLSTIEGPHEGAQTLWPATAAALGLLAAGLAWRPVRALRVRAALGRLTVAGTETNIRAVLSSALRDPSVRLVLPEVQPEAGPGRARTAVERRGRVVAWVEHRADLRATPELLTATVRTAGLTLEREALRAAQELQERELRASTLRLVSVGEAERRRLERDLHDGAQQRLLALGLGLARARSIAPAATAATLTEAEARVAVVRGRLRQIAHGIHSVTLAEGGLAEAVLALVQTAGGGVAVEALPEERAPAEAEAAVYRLVAASLRLEQATGVRLAIRSDTTGLDAGIRVSGVGPAELSDALAHAGARVTALGGSLAVAAADGGASARARVPPGSP